MEEKRKIFNQLCHTVGILDISWGEYKILYVREDDDYSIIDGTSKSFFDNIQMIFAHYLLLEIAKLLDPKKSKIKGFANQNFCFEQLFETSELKDLKNLTNDIKVWRNKILSHLDLDHIFDQSKLPNLHNKIIGQVVDEMKKLLTNFATINNINPTFPNTKFSGSAQVVLECLKKGM